MCALSRFSSRVGSGGFASTRDLNVFQHQRWNGERVEWVGCAPRFTRTGRAFDGADGSGAAGSLARAAGRMGRPTVTVGVEGIVRPPGSAAGAGCGP